MKVSQYFTIRERQTQNLFELTQVLCALFSLLSKFFSAKIKYISATLPVVSPCSSGLVSSHNAIYSPLERELVA